jgi:transcriptional regulator with XRE-family HTH domain
MLNFTKVFERIKVLTDIQNKGMVATLFELDIKHIDNWDKRGVFPWDRVLELASIYDVNPIYFIQDEVAPVLIDSPEVKRTFAYRLKRTRQDNQLTQKELAKKAGTFQQTIQNWENNSPTNPNAAVVKRVAKALDISPIFLRLGKEFQKPDSGKERKVLFAKEAGQLGDEINLIRLESAEKIQKMNSDFSTQKKQVEVITQQKVDLLMEQVRFMMLGEENMKHTLAKSGIPTLFQPAKTK